MANQATDEISSRRGVKRNIDRFLADFMFQLTTDEAANLRSQAATSSGHGGRRYAPYAVAVNIAIMRAFVELRRAAMSYAAIERRLTELERESKERLGKHDQQLADVFEALRQLISPPPRPKRRVGFGLPRSSSRR